MFPPESSCVSVSYVPRAAHPRGQCADVGEDGVDEAGLGAAIGVEVEGEALDERRADDRGVGGARHCGGLRRGLDAEPDRDRQLRKAAQPRDRGAHARRHRPSGCR